MTDLLPRNEMKLLAFTRFIFFTLLLVFITSTVTAQTLSVAQVRPEPQTNAVENDVTNDETKTRFKQLESQVQAMQAELEALKNLIIKNQTPPPQASAVQPEAIPKTPAVATRTAAAKEP